MEPLKKKWTIILEKEKSSFNFLSSGKFILPVIARQEN